MKLIHFFVLIVLGVMITGADCHGQPNTSTVLEVGIVNPQPDKSYLFFSEIKTDTSSSRLAEDMDYLNPNVSDLLVTLTNPTTVGDTLFYDYAVPDNVAQRYIKAGLVQVNQISLKYSGMSASSWVALDTIEQKPAGFIFRRKK